jgi:hypothetical protein
LEPSVFANALAFSSQPFSFVNREPSLLHHPPPLHGRSRDIERPDERVFEGLSGLVSAQPENQEIFAHPVNMSWLMEIKAVDNFRICDILNFAVFEV